MKTQSAPESRFQTQLDQVELEIAQLNEIIIALDKKLAPVIVASNKCGQGESCGSPEPRQMSEYLQRLNNITLNIRDISKTITVLLNNLDI